MKKGQAATELLITLGIILAFTVPVVFLLFTATQTNYEETAKAQADAAARALGESINLVYSQGSGAKITILLSTPQQTKRIEIGNGEVIINMEISGGEYETAYPIFAKISGGSIELNRKGLLILEISSNINSEIEIEVK